MSPLIAEPGLFFGGTFRMTVVFVDVAMAAAEQVGAFLPRSLPVGADHVIVAEMNTLGRQGGNDRRTDERSADDGR